MHEKIILRGVAAFLGSLAVACSGGQDPSAPSIAHIQDALAPAGYHASVVSHTIPSSMVPGERLNLRIVMNNDGTVAWGAGAVMEYSNNNPQIFAATQLASSIAPGSNATYDFIAVAPAANPSYTMSSVLYLDGGPSGSGFFGPLDVSGINVSASNTRRWSCGLVQSTLPTSLRPGQQASGTVTVVNNGSATWLGSGLCLYDVGSPQGQWGGQTVCNPLDTSVAPGQTASFSYSFTAPSTPGTYAFQMQMFDSNPVSPSGGVGLFSQAASNACVNLSIAVETPMDDAAIVSQNFPTTMVAGDHALVSVTMKNSGTQTWTTDQRYMLYNMAQQWNSAYSIVPTVTPSGQNVTFSFYITAPSTPGTYTHDWRMFDTSIPFGFFGQEIIIPVTVQAGGTKAYDASVVSQNIPPRMDPGAYGTFQIKMQNTGTMSWSAAQGFQLLSVNNPYGLWETVWAMFNASDMVAPGQSYIFSFSVKAPSTAGNYASAWQMSQPGGANNFGAVAGAQVAVTYCGNGKTQPQYGEQCDDGNLIDGDGCSSTCQIEAKSIDTAAAAGFDRELVGAQNAGQLANIAVGDIDGDGVADLLVAEIQPNRVAYRSSPPPNMGTVRGYLGSAGFFDGTSAASPDVETFEIRGPNDSALLGAGYSGSLVAGDVTGDGVADIVAGAPGYNGSGGGRPNSGAVYVIAGQSGLATVGLIDLSSSSSAQWVHLMIAGASSGDYIRVIGLGDLDGDGVPDIIVGAPGQSSNGLAGSGAVYVVRGNATGTVDLANESDSAILAIVRGAAAGDQLGEVAAAIGDITGDGRADLVVASSRSSPGGVTGAGAAWAIFAPVPKSSNLAGAQFSAAFYGEYNYDGLGQTVAIGQVRGDATLDLVIGTRDGWNDPSNTLVGYVDVWTGPVAGGVHDLGAGAMPSSRVYGRAVHSLLGSSLVLADMNRDGYMDLVMGAPGTAGPNGDRANSGEVTVVLGGQNMAASTDLALMAAPALRTYGPMTSGNSGINPFNIAVGDLDGDGHLDLVMGTPYGGTGASGQIDLFRGHW